MAKNGDYVYIYGVIGTPVLPAGEVRGIEWSTRIRELVRAGYLALYNGPSIADGRSPTVEEVVENYTHRPGNR